MYLAPRPFRCCVQLPVHKLIENCLLSLETIWSVHFPEGSVGDGAFLLFILVGGAPGSQPQLGTV